MKKIAFTSNMIVFIISGILFLAFVVTAFQGMPQPVIAIKSLAVSIFAGLNAYALQDNVNITK